MLWAAGQFRAIGEQYASGTGPFPERLPELQLTSRFLTDFYLLVAQWARWAAGIAETWPDDPRQAKPDPQVIADDRTPRRGRSPSGSELDIGPAPRAALIFLAEISSALSGPPRAVVSAAA